MRTATLERIANKISRESSTEEAIKQVKVLQGLLRAALLRSKALREYVEIAPSCAPFLAAKNQPRISLGFKKLISPKYASSLQFTLLEGKLQAKVYTLFLKDAADDYDYQIVAGCAEQDPPITFHCVEGLAKAAAHRALEQRIGMLSDLGFSVSHLSPKKLTRTAEIKLF
jgi:hypothetical protein